MKGPICALYFLAPFLCPKKLVLRSTRNYALSWKVPERSSIFGADLDFCLVADFSNSQFGLFRPPPTRHCSPNSWNVREIPRICVCRIGRFSTNPGASGIRCAGQVPPSPDFRPSALSFVWEFLLTGLRHCFSA